MGRLAIYALTLGIAACSMIKPKQPPHQPRSDGARETYYVNPGRICRIKGEPQLEELTGIRVERANGRLRITGKRPKADNADECEIGDIDLELNHAIGCGLSGEVLFVTGIIGGRLRIDGQHLDAKYDEVDERIVFRITQRGLAEVETSSIISCGTGYNILIWVPEHDGIYTLESAEGMMLRKQAGLEIPEDRFIALPQEIINQGILDVVFDGTQIIVRTVQQTWSGGEGIYWGRFVDPQGVEWKPMDKKVVLQ